MDSTAVTFAKCRSEVREFTRHYVNWPRSRQLLTDLTSTGCPLITVHEPYQFRLRQPGCTLH